MKKLKRLAYSLLIVSYLMIGSIMIFSNLIDSLYHEKLFLLLKLLAVAIWLIAPCILAKASNQTEKADKVTAGLKFIAFLPLYVILAIIMSPICIVVILPIEIIVNRFRNKVKPLLKVGFTLRREKTGKERIYYLSKEMVVIKIKEFDVYEISNDGGNIFKSIESSSFFVEEEKEDFKNELFHYYGCDYRDRDLYDPTRKLISIITQKFNS